MSKLNDKQTNLIGWTRTGLIVIFLCALAVMFDGYDLVVYGTVLPVLLKELQISSIQAGAIGSYALIGMLLGAIIFGPLGDKWGRKTALLISVTVYSMAMPLAAMANSPQLFAFWRLIGGLGLGGVLPVAVSLAVEHAPKHWRNTAVVVIYSGYNLGGVLSALLGIYILPKLGWRLLFWIGGLPLILIPFIVKYVPSKLELLYDRTTREQRGRISDLFRQGYARATILFWLAFFMQLLMLYGLNTWLPQLMRQAGYPLGSSITFLLILNLFGVIGGVIAGRISDSIGSKKVLISYYIIASASIFLLSYPLSQFWLNVLVALAGFGTFGASMIANSFVGTYYPGKIRGTGLGWALGVGRIGAIIGPFLGGFLLSLNEGLKITFTAFSISGLTAAFAILFVAKKVDS